TARAVTTPQVIDNLSWVHGAHAVRAGINFRFYIHNDSRGNFGSAISIADVVFNRTRLGNFNNLPATIGGDAATAPNSADINRLNQAIVELAGVPRSIQ